MTSCTRVAGVNGDGSGKKCCHRIAYLGFEKIESTDKRKDVKVGLLGNNVTSVALPILKCDQCD